MTTLLQFLPGLFLETQKPGSRVGDCALSMSILNEDSYGVWDASFEIHGETVIWKAGIHPAVIFFNFHLPADHMTDIILPLLGAHGLLTGVKFDVPTRLHQKYQEARG